MPNPAPALRHAIAGALEPTRIFVRYRASDAGPAAPESCTEATLASGDALLGPVRARVEVESDGGDCATWRTRVQNAGAEPVRVEAVGLGFRWRGPDAGALRFLRQGFQSWSFAGGAALDDAGTPPFPSGPWLRGFHHATPERPADRAGWHESDLVTAVGVSPRGPTCAVGVLESGVALGVVYLRRDGEAVRLEAEQRLEVPLEPGAVFELEPVRVALGDDAAPLLEAAAEAWGRHAGARTHAPFQAGWCSWYHFFHDVTEADFLRNLESLAAA
ncbi:MAG: hypothetical protein QNK03_24610, partial [Myxococcota bacterium]|nr:hypothetical protein [Myxococcota bacterium]